MDLSKIVGLIKNKPAKINEIMSAERELGIGLPKVYIDLLNSTNGLVNDNGIGVYGTDELIERNQTWEVNEYAKGYVAIGDDAGGKVLLMKYDINAREVIAVDSGYMNPYDKPEIITNNFEKWIYEGCVIESEEISAKLCDIIIEKTPSGGTKDLLMIKKAFGVDISITEMFKESKQPPFTIIKEVSYEKAVSRMKALGGLADVLRLELIVTE